MKIVGLNWQKQKQSARFIKMADCKSSAFRFLTDSGPANDLYSDASRNVCLYCLFVSAREKGSDRTWGKRCPRTGGARNPIRFATRAAGRRIELSDASGGDGARFIRARSCKGRRHLGGAVATATVDSAAAIWICIRARFEPRLVHFASQKACKFMFC